MHSHGATVTALHLNFLTIPDWNSVLFRQKLPLWSLCHMVFLICHVGSTCSSRLYSFCAVKGLLCSCFRGLLTYAHSSIHLFVYFLYFSLWKLTFTFPPQTVTKLSHYYLLSVLRSLSWNAPLSCTLDRLRFDSRHSVLFQYSFFFTLSQNFLGWSYIYHLFL